MKAWKIPPPVEWKVTAGHGGVARRRHENLALCQKHLLVAAGHGLKERRQWALSSVSGPPCFGLCSCFARFFKNQKKTKKAGWFIGSEVTPSGWFIGSEPLVFFYV